tara:strand:+ start:372 stop:599 length:228 start_codon:yes stop_codon:yes gene_type:complete
MSYTLDKMMTAIKTLKADVECAYHSDNGWGASTEEDFNKIEWKTGEDSGGSAITTTVNPHSEITWTKVKEEMDKL